jgi:hypothetical protein
MTQNSVSKKAGDSQSVIRLDPSANSCAADLQQFQSILHRKSHRRHTDLRRAAVDESRKRMRTVPLIEGQGLLEHRTAR